MATGPTLEERLAKVEAALRELQQRLDARARPGLVGAGHRLVQR
jgi:hypothetical protein